MASLPIIEAHDPAHIIGKIHEAEEGWEAEIPEGIPLNPAAPGSHIGVGFEILESERRNGEAVVTRIRLRYLSFGPRL